MEQSYELAVDINGQRTYTGPLGRLVLVRTDDHASYALTMNDRERVEQLYKEVEQHEHRDSETQLFTIVLAALRALLHDNLKLSINSFAATVEALYTNDTELIVGAIRELFVRTGFGTVRIRATEIFSAQV